MKAFRPGLAITLCLLMAMVAVLSTQTTANAPSQATTVAVIDVMKLYEELQEWLEIEAEQQQKTQRFQEERQRRVEEINALQRDLGITPENTPIWEKKQDELLAKTAEYQAWGQIQQQRIQREIALRLQALEKKMTAAIEATARDNNIDLVMNRQSNIPLVQGGQQQQQQNFNLRMVLYARDTLDITHEVAQRMNNEFRNRQR